MEIVRSACPIYRSTMIPASRVALLSSIQVNDRGKAAPAVPYRRSDLVLWPVADATVAARHGRFLGSTCRRRTRGSATGIDPLRTPTVHRSSRDNVDLCGGEGNPGAIASSTSYISVRCRTGTDRYARPCCVEAPHECPAGYDPHQTVPTNQWAKFDKTVREWNANL
jgi:hypothetical protein